MSNANRAIFNPIAGEPLNFMLGGGMYAQTVMNTQNCYLAIYRETLHAICHFEDKVVVQRLGEFFFFFVQ